MLCVENVEELGGILRKWKRKEETTNLLLFVRSFFEEKVLNSNLHNVPFSLFFARILVNLTKTSSLEAEKATISLIIINVLF